MSEDAALLRSFVSDRSESAFAELVRRHVGLVYHTALRHLNGDTHGAEDVAQTVFADLARKAAALSHRPVLANWLYTSTRYAALKRRRTERRREAREQEAILMQALVQDSVAPVDWQRLHPVIDDGLNALNERDREAVLLHFFQGRDFAQMGQQLGLSPQGARSRVERAVEKLHARLARRGVTSTTAALALALGTQSIAAPAGLATATSAAALAIAATGGTASAGLAFFTMSKVTLVVTAVTVLALSVTYQVKESRLRTDLAAEAHTEKQTLTALQTEVHGLRQRLADLPSIPSAPTVAASNPDDELTVRLTALQQAINEGGLGNRISWEKLTLAETVAGIGTVLEAEPEKIGALQAIAERTLQDILANALRAAVIEPYPDGSSSRGFRIRTQDLPENRATYESMLANFARILGPARYGFFESLGAKGSVDGILMQNGLGTRFLNVSLVESRPGYYLSVPNRAATMSVMSDGSQRMVYPSGTQMRSSQHTSREDLKKALGPFGVLLPEDL